MTSEALNQEYIETEISPEKIELFESLLTKAEEEYYKFRNLHNWEEFYSEWQNDNLFNRKSGIKLRKVWLEIKKEGKVFKNYLREKMRSNFDTEKSNDNYYLFQIYSGVQDKDDNAFFCELLSNSSVWNNPDGSMASNVLEQIGDSNTTESVPALEQHIYNIFSHNYSRHEFIGVDFRSALGTLISVVGKDKAYEFLEEWKQKNMNLNDFLVINESKFSKEKFYKHVDPIAPAEPEEFNLDTENERIKMLEETVNESVPSVDMDDDFDDMYDHFYDDLASDSNGLEDSTAIDASIEKLQGEILSDLSEIDNLAPKSAEDLDVPKEARRIIVDTLKKVSERLGSNDGGWYEDSETGKKYYIKFYQNPDQARIEFVANAIYKKLGIKAVDSELLEFEQKLAIASGEIPGAQSATKEEQQGSTDVRSGFIADAFLANWDVIGLVFDNVVKDENGNMYRIDNGGSLVFRAQGGDKEYSGSEIPELKNMLNPNYNAGKVFEGLTDEEMKRQATHLVNTLRESDIDEILEKSGLPEDKIVTLKKSMVGRIKFLREKFEIKKTQLKSERIPVAMEKLKEQAEKIKGTEIRPRVGFLGDSNKIENQQIDIIDSEDLGSFVVSLKLTAEHYKKILEKLRAVNLLQDEIHYTSTSKNTPTSFNMGKALVINKGDIKVKVAQGKKQAGWGYNENIFYSALGLVQIDIPKKIAGDIDDVTALLEDLFDDVLNIPDALEIPTEEAEKNYKRNRYTWHHKLGKMTDEQIKEVDEKLKREEVFPGYFTFVEPDKSKEYKEISPYSVYHDIRSNETLVQIMKVGGLLCTHERYKRGLLYEGMSSDSDLEHGGADSIFTRTITQKCIETQRAGTSYGADSSFGTEVGGTKLIFSSSLFDRTDWYAYREDSYGRVRPDYFINRQSPNELLNDQSKSYNSGNEQMFRHGISIKDVVAISCSNFDELLETERILIAGGVTEINGKPVDEFLVLVNSYDQCIELSMGTRSAGTRSFAEIKRDEPEMLEKAIYKAIISFTESIAERVSRGDSVLDKLSSSYYDFYDKKQIVRSYFTDSMRYINNIIDGEDELLLKAPVKYTEQAIEKLNLLKEKLELMFSTLVKASTAGSYGAISDDFEIESRKKEIEILEKRHIEVKNAIELRVNKFESILKEKTNEQKAA